MEDSYMEQLEAFFEELLAGSLEKMKEENTEYNKLFKKHSKLEDEVNCILERLPNEDKEKMEKFSEVKIDLKFIEQKYIYQQGYRDCMKFFRHIHAFHD